MTTPTIEQIYRHGSMRHYKPDPVEPEIVEAIVAAGQRASTSSNLQTYSVVAVSDKEKRARLMALCDNQRHIMEAPIFLAWCADQSRLNRISAVLGYEQTTRYVESFLIAAMDAALAMQNAALAAESMGLGMCYIGAIRNNPREIIELLELPRLVFPISGMTMGWPAKDPHFRPRLPLEAVLHWESYGTEGEDALLEMYDLDMIETGIYKGRRVPVPGREGETRAYGWREHSARRASRPVRTHLREVLEEQGYDLD